MDNCFTFMASLFYRFGVLYQSWDYRLESLIEQKIPQVYKGCISKCSFLVVYSISDVKWWRSDSEASPTGQSE